MKLIGRPVSLAVKRLFSSSASDKKTPLYDFHVQNGAKMVPFCGYSMPVQYADQSIIESHLHTRRQVSLFDVSHMLQTKIYGKHRLEFMESLTPADLKSLKINSGTLTIFTNDQGGIKDDLIVMNSSDNYLYVVTNAGCVDKDLEHMQNSAENFRKQGYDVTVEPQDQNERCLVAVQGPGVAQLLSSILPFDFTKLYFMNTIVSSIDDIPECRITRCGYTGEDGVEISVASKYAVDLCTRLLKSKSTSVKLAGLGARDSLRLEAGLCLYGQDIDEMTTPVEANLNWLLAKRRRETADFLGASIILAQLKAPIARKRIGYIGEKGRPARSGAKILDENDQIVGRVTSGCPSPSLKQNVAMGYCTHVKATPGTPFKVSIGGGGGGGGQGQTVDLKVAKMPFLPTHYHVMPKK